MKREMRIWAVLGAGLPAVAAAGPALAQSALTVEIVTANTAPAAMRLELTGTIEATGSVPISFKSAGRIVEIGPDVGDTVAAGDVLARVDPTQAEAAERAAMAQLAAAAASLTQAELARDRAADLLSRRVGTQAELDAAEASLLAARSQYEQSEAELNTARQAVDDTVIEAPIGGMITARDAEPGQIAGAGQPVLTIAPAGEREAVFYAPNVPQLDTVFGTRFEVQPIESDGPSLPAMVTEISPLADVTTGTVLVRARLEDGADTVGLGTSVSSTIEVPVPDTISLPWSALATTGGEPAVWRVDPTSGAVSLVPVEIAHFTTGTVEVASGLEDGDQVVAAGSNWLFPGRVVQAAGENQ